MSTRISILLVVLLAVGCSRKEPSDAKSLSELTLEFYNALELIGEEHEELYDTDVREALRGALNYYFVWGNDTSEMPVSYAMFSAEGDASVANAVREFCSQAKALAESEGMKTGQPREDVLQDAAVTTRGGQSYDEFIGYADRVPPEEKPHEIYYSPGTYD